MEWVFYIMVVFCLFDIEEKLKKLMTNNQEKNNTQKEKNKIIEEILPEYKNEITLNKGDKLVIIGEEGNGKSTLIKSIYEKLKERNLKLVNILTGTFKSDLELSIKNNYLDRFYYECKL